MTGQYALRSELAPRRAARAAPPLWRRPPTERPLLGGPGAAGPPPLTAPTDPPPRPARKRSATAGVLAAAATTLAALGAGAFLTAGPGPGGPADAGRPPFVIATQPSAAPDTRTDFTTIGDACALPTAASLQRLAPDGDDKAWHTGDDSWTCFRTGRESSRWFEGVGLYHLLGSVLVEFSVVPATASRDATAGARAEFEKRSGRDRARWRGRYDVLPQVGDAAYSGYEVTGGDGEARATVRLRNVVFTVGYGGTAWRDLEPKTPMAEPAARAGAVTLAREVAQALARCGECRSGLSAPPRDGRGIELRWAGPS
ncbi:hypothetical protein [Actinomadura chibensis]|uniref:DUF3558 domain-containing protein n=1 Tax=Actinomadura chibensis TaxID=392828 RepID=A0A5D0NWC0_9ACTN|nr:hypothetical protein [Actinomadura chibensis]TYB48562.1 hypothetical protein FXF69_05075 [Actinomadura chibensis]